MQILILNGPNLNLLGQREVGIYGSESMDQYIDRLKKGYTDVSIDYFQSNIEGELINKLHEVGFSYDGIIFNPGGYSHTSVSLSDAIAAISSTVIEVHISNLYAREEYRHVSLTAKNCAGVISGFGIKGYEIAMKTLID